MPIYNFCQALSCELQESADDEQRGCPLSSYIYVWVWSPTYWPINPTIFNIIRWFAGTYDSSTKCLMFQSFSFHNFLQDSLQKLLEFIFLICFIDLQNRNKEFEWPKSKGIMKKKCLEHQVLGRWVVCPIDPATQVTGVLFVGFYVRLLKCGNVFSQFFVPYSHCHFRNFFWIFTNLTKQCCTQRE